MYYLTWVVLLFSVLLEISKKKKVSKILLGSSILLMIIIIMIRFGYGADYLSYEFLYRTIDTSSISNLLKSHTKYEIGFRLLEYVGNNLGVPYHVFLVILNLITFFFFYLWIRDQSESPAISWFVFYSMFFMVWVLSALRQGFVLALGSYFFFSNRKFSNKVKIIVSILLGLIHSIGFVYLIVMLVDKLRVDKKKHFYILGISVLANLLPLGAILNAVPFLANYRGVLTYIDAYRFLGFIDFASIIRFLFFAIVIYHYDLLKERFKGLVDIFLLGFSVYFLMRFSALMSSRITIHTYILLIIFLPTIIKQYVNKKSLKLIVLAAFIGFNSLFFMKEMLTAIDQTGEVTDSKIVKFYTVFESPYDKFDGYNGRNIVLRNQNKVKSIMEEYLNSEQYTDRKEVSYNENDDYFVRYDKFTNTFKVMNQDGFWLKGDSYPKTGTVYKDVLVTRENRKDSMFDSSLLIDITGKNRKQSEMLEVVEKYQAEHFVFNEFNKEVQESVTVDDVREILEYFFPNVDAGVKEINMVKINQPFTYFVLEVDYNDRLFYIYLDEEKELLIDILFSKSQKFNVNGILSVSMHGYSISFNKYGKIIIGG